MRALAFVALLGLALLTGCREKAPPGGGVGSEDTADAEAGNAPLNHAQPRLATVKLWLGAQELVAEVCRTPTEIMTGMMFRTNIAENEGMLFHLRIPQRASFYMRNTTVPLSCAYIDPEGVILEIHDLDPLNEKPVESKAANVLFVLETAQGWFQRHNVAPGTLINTPYGPLRGLDWTTLRPRGARSP